MEDEEDINGLIGQLIRKGVIQSVDLAAGRAVIEVGEIVSPPLPWVEAFAGLFRSWSPPSEGEQAILLCPEGDIEGAIILRGLTSDQFPKPSDTADHSIHGAEGLIFTLTPAGLQIVAPQGVEITADVTITGNVAVTGDIGVTGDVSASGTVTGDTDAVGGGISLKNHTHSGVAAGTASTGGPQ
jgi:phage baseplate assembly protein V